MFSVALETSELHWDERKHTFSLETPSDGVKYQSCQEIDLEHEFQYEFLFKHLLPSYWHLSRMWKYTLGSNLHKM